MSVSGAARLPATSLAAVYVSVKPIFTGFFLLPALLGLKLNLAVYVLSVAATATDAPTSTASAVQAMMMRRKPSLLCLVLAMRTHGSGFSCGNAWFCPVV